MHTVFFDVFDISSNIIVVVVVVDGVFVCVCFCLEIVVNKRSSSEIDSLLTNFDINSLIPNSNFDGVGIIDSHSFVLQNILILMNIVLNRYSDSHKIIGKWILDEGKITHACLSQSLIIITNYNQLENNNNNNNGVNLKQLVCEPASLIKKREENNDKLAQTDRRDEIVSMLKELETNSDENGILALPWWYIMTTKEYSRYIVNIKNNNDNIARNRNMLYEQNRQGSAVAALTNPQMVLDLLRKTNLWSDEQPQRSIKPLVIDLSLESIINSNKESEQVDSDLFWDDWVQLWTDSVAQCISGIEL